MERIQPSASAMVAYCGCVLKKNKKNRRKLSASIVLAFGDIFFCPSNPRTVVWIIENITRVFIDIVLDHG